MCFQLKFHEIQTIKTIKFSVRDIDLLLLKWFGYLDFNKVENYYKTFDWHQIEFIIVVLVLILWSTNIRKFKIAYDS